MMKPVVITTLLSLVLGCSQVTFEKKSEDNYLKSLKVEGYSFLENFTPDTASYTLSVENEVENVLLVCVPNDVKSSVKGVGEKKLIVGINSFEVLVTAENGNIRKYNVVITRADLKPVFYSVKYEPNGGTGQCEDSNSPYKNGAEVTIKDNLFKREGYVFSAWNTSSKGEGTTILPNEKLKVTQDLILFAQWTDTVSASYIANAKASLTIGFNSGNGFEKVTSDVILPTRADNDVVISWNSSNQGLIGNNGVLVNRPGSKQGDTNVTLTATISRNQVSDKKVFTIKVIAWPFYKVTFETSGGTAIPEIVVAHNDSIKQPVSPEKSLYTFAGWFFDPELTLPCSFIKNGTISYSDFKITKDTMLYAKWLGKGKLVIVGGYKQVGMARQVIFYLQDNEQSITIKNVGTDVIRRFTIKFPAGIYCSASDPYDIYPGETRTVKILPDRFEIGKLNSANFIPSKVNSQCVNYVSTCYFDDGNYTDAVIVIVDLLKPTPPASQSTDKVNYVPDSGYVRPHTVKEVTGTRENGTITILNDGKIDSFKATFAFSTLLGEPLIDANYLWNSSSLDKLSSNAILWIKISGPIGSAFIRFSPTVPSEGVSSYNVTSSPSWGKLMAKGFSGANPMDYFSADEAKMIWKGGFNVVDAWIAPTE